MAPLHERIGKSINELDIDFSRFTVAGWLMSVASLSVGLLTALAAYQSVNGKLRGDEGPALIFGIVMIGTTVVSFLAIRAFLSKLGVSVVRRGPSEEDQTLN